MARIVKHIIISFLAIILMSHNSFATEISINAVPIWTNYSSTVCFDIVLVGATCNSSGYLNSSSSTESVRSITFNMPSGFNTVSGKTIAVFNVVMDNFATDNSIDGVFLNPIVKGYNGAKWGLVDVKSFSQGSGSFRVQFTFLAESSASIGSNGYIKVGTNYNNSELAFLKPNERISGGMGSFFHIEGSGTQAIVDAINNSSDAAAIQNAKNVIVDAIEKQQQDDQQAVQDVVDDAQSSADSSQSDVDSASANFLESLGIIIDVFKNAEPGNCNISFSATSPGLSNFMNSVGSVNLCSNVPESILNIMRALASLVITPVVLSCAYSLVNTMYKMFNEVQE